MRLVCAVLLTALCAHAEPAVTLVLKFDDAYSTRSLAAMKREVASIVGESGIKVDCLFLADVHTSDSFENLVVVRFRGACVMQPRDYMRDERGYYAFTYVSDGDVLPFSEVECDKVANSIRAEMITFSAMAQIAIRSSAAPSAACWRTSCSICWRNRNITEAKE